MDRSARFALFVEELNGAAPVATLEEARMLLEAVLNGVEDRYSGVEFDPANWRDDGRLYPPQDDREIEADQEGVRTFKTVGHHVSFGANGAIRITKIAFTPGSAFPAVVVDKPGRDGRKIS